MAANRTLAPLIVLSGPSGAGKTTIVDAALAACHYPLRRAITATTRPPRPGERHGVDYYFWTRAEFDDAIAGGAMLEHATVFGKDSYGTPKAEVNPHRERGTGVLLVIDVQGASLVRQALPGDGTSIFLDVPTMADLEQRLRSRGTEDDARIARRLAAAEAERQRAGEFDVRIVNVTVLDAVAELVGLIDEEFHRKGFVPCSTN